MAQGTVVDNLPDKEKDGYVTHQGAFTNLNDVYKKDLVAPTTSSSTGSNPPEGATILAQVAGADNLPESEDGPQNSGNYEGEKTCKANKDDWLVYDSLTIDDQAFFV